MPAAIATTFFSAPPSVDESVTGKVAVKALERPIEVVRGEHRAPVAHLDHAATLLRLSRALGWSLARTDRALEIFGGLDGIDEPVLLALAGVRWLARALRLDPDAVLDFYGPLDTRRWTPRIADGVPDGASPPSATRGRGRRPVLHSANAGDGDADEGPARVVDPAAGAGAASVDEVIRSIRGQAVESRRQAGEGFRFRSFVSVGDGVAGV